MLYAIARHGSKVTSRQFEEYCLDIGTPLSPATSTQLGLFDLQMIQAAYQVEEPVFDAGKLRIELRDRILNHSAIRFLARTRCTHVHSQGRNVLVSMLGWSGVENIVAKRVFNCTYSGLGRIEVDARQLKTKLKPLLSG
jgi:hypothetical protein